LQELLVDAITVLLLRVVHFTNQFPYLASHLLALNLVETLFETIPETLVGKMFHLQLQIMWESIIFPYAKGENDDPLFS
jgi:hypothetical protein